LLLLGAAVVDCIRCLYKESTFAPAQALGLFGWTLWRLLVYTGIDWHKRVSKPTSCNESFSEGSISMALPHPSSLNTVEEVAQALRLQPETVRQMARDGRLPAHKVGRVWRFNPAAIRNWLRPPSDAAGLPLPSGDRVAELVLPLYDVSPPEPNGTAFKDPAFTENRNQSVHRWVPWIAGFSAGFVQDCLNEYLVGVDPAQALVLDPFAGVGTTLVEASRGGYHTVGFEINPYAALAARAKLEAMEVSVAELQAWTNAFRAFMDTVGTASPADPAWAPPGFRSRIPFFSPRVQPQVLWALKFIEGMSDQKLKDLFLVATGSVMVKFSNYTYEPSLATRPGSGKPLVEWSDVAGVISTKLRDMIDDCRSLQADARGVNPGVRRQMFQDSIFNADKYLSPASVDLAVTSPPYLNNYHYIRNTRPHLFWLRFIQDTTDLRQIEHSSFGKFWQTVRDGDRLDLTFELPELEAVIDRIRQRNLDRGIYGGPGWANYAAQYFNDTYRLCEVMRALLKPGGRLVVVIGNSILQGIEIKVDEFLAQIGRMHGLECEATHMLRTKRVGNSIIRSSVRNAAEHKVALYEVAVVLRKPTVNA
jgi:excisionase family DNA binding protein